MTRTALVALVVSLATAAAAQAVAGSGKRTFILAVRPGQCLTAGSKNLTGSDKTVLVVPCSDARHQFEVYAVRHGGWGHRKVPPLATVTRIMNSICDAAYREITGHELPTGGGWDAFAPDPGAEQARYGDKIICSYVHYPTDTALGRGWHVH